MEEPEHNIQTEIITTDGGFVLPANAQIDPATGNIIAYVDNQPVIVNLPEGSDVVTVDAASMSNLHATSLGSTILASQEQVCIAPRISRPSMSLVDLGKRLLHSSRQGDTEQVRQLMASGAPFTTDWLGTSPLHFAAHSGHLLTTDTLLRAGISRDARTKVDRTPLHCACQEGHRLVVEALLKHGADIEAKDMLKMTPLHWAIERNHIDVVDLLLKNGADTNQEDKFDRTPIHIAVQNNRLSIAHLLQTQQTNTANSVNEAVSNIPSFSQSGMSDSIVDAASMASSSHLSTPLPITHKQRKPSRPKNQSARTTGADPNSSVLATLAALAEATGPRGPQSTSQQDAFKWLENHGITMISEDAAAAETVSTSSAMSGVGATVGGTGVLTLTEAGKLALNLVKGEDDKKSGARGGARSYQLSTDENGQDMITIVTEEQHVDTQQEEFLQPASKRVRFMTSDDSASEEMPIDSMNATELKRHLEEMQKQAREYKIQLEKKEREADQYKRKLDEITKAATSGSE